jgi:hypothetical protein
MSTQTPESSRPRIGAFTKPKDRRADNNETQETSDQDQEAKKSNEDDEDDVDESQMPPKTGVEAEAEDRLSLYQQMQDALLPVEDYKKYLKEQKIEETKAAEIVDNLMTNGFHEEEYDLSRSKSITFRTREQRDTLRLQAQMQIQRPLFQDAVDEMVTRYNMAKMFDDRLLFVERLPAPVWAKMSIKLAQFDRLVAAVMREGVAENF